MPKLLFVCLGNICRSPTAHGVFAHIVAEQGLSDFFELESAGTSAFHVGEAPDTRSQACAAKRGYDLSWIRSQQVSEADFHHYDHILAMDEANLQALEALCPSQANCQIELFLNYCADPAQKALKAVPDPYYGGAQGFDQVVDLVEGACQGLLTHLLTSSRPTC